MQHLSQIKNFFFQKTLLGFWGSILLTIPFLFSPQKVNAQELAFTCPNRFVTLVNPVRGRSFWLDQSLAPIKNQYKAVKDMGFPATWLLQYEALIDSELINYLKTFDSNQELGIFLEITQPLTNKVKIVYPYATAWASPKAVFLSGYSRGQRRSLVNEIFQKYKDDFGYYPKSVGAWWIDSYSLGYMVKRFGITSVLIVADQKTTDHYGVWGQWWGVPYYPSSLNVLVPPKNTLNKLDVVVTQWAQRDLLKAMGEGYKFSNYSLQANDYIKQGKNTDYFSKIISQYLDCKNPISQITVGLETGMEAVGYLGEYKNQLNLLSQSKGLTFVTMSDFYQSFKRVYPEIVTGYTLGDGDDAWHLNPDFRENKFLEERVVYPDKVVFPDFFIKDSSTFLRRYVMDLSELKSKFNFPYWVLILVGMGIIFLRKTNWKIALSLTTFIFLSYCLVFISFEKYGWQVFYGSQIDNLAFIQISLAFLPLAFYYLILPIIKNNLHGFLKFSWFLPLTFGFDWLASLIKVSRLNGLIYFGVFWQKTTFVGLTLSEKFSKIGFVSEIFDIGRADNFLSWSISKVFFNPVLWVIVYPAAHLLTAFFLFLVYQKASRGLKKVILVVLIVFLAGFIYSLTKVEPELVLPILK